MSKRFTDTDKWKKKWFRSLSNDHKVFWQFLLDNCNHAGMWDVDFEYASIFCGVLDEVVIRDVFKKQYIELNNGKQWFIRDFIDFQYGTLNPNNNLHKSVIQYLEKSGANELLNSPSEGAKEKDKVKEEEKEGGLGETKKEITSPPKKSREPTQIQTLLLTFAEKYEKKFSIPYQIKWERDGPNAKGLLETYSLDGLIKVIGVYFEMKDKFFEENGYTFGLFVSGINKIMNLFAKQVKGGTNAVQLH